MQDIQKCHCRNRGYRQDETYTDYKIQVGGVRYWIRRCQCTVCNDAAYNIVSVIPYPNPAVNTATYNKYANADATHLAAYAAAYPWR